MRTKPRMDWRARRIQPVASLFNCLLQETRPLVLRALLPLYMGWLACTPVYGAGRLGPAETGILGQVIRTFTLRNEPMLGAVRDLRKVGVPVCFEEVELDAKRDRVFDDQGHPLSVRKRTISVSLAGVTVRGVLDALVTADDSYLWRIDDDTGIVNIMPKGLGDNESGSVLSWTIQSINAVRRPRLAVIEEDLRLSEHHIYLFWRGPMDAYSPKIDLHLESVAAWKALNRLVIFAPRLCWTLAGFKGGRVLTLVPDEGQ